MDKVILDKRKSITMNFQIYQNCDMWQNWTPEITRGGLKLLGNSIKYAGENEPDIFIWLGNQFTTSSPKNLVKSLLATWKSELVDLHD